MSVSNKAPKRRIQIKHRDVDWYAESWDRIGLPYWEYEKEEAVRNAIAAINLEPDEPCDLFVTCSCGRNTIKRGSSSRSRCASCRKEIDLLASSRQMIQESDAEIVARVKKEMETDGKEVLRKNVHRGFAQRRGKNPRVIRSSHSQLFYEN